MYQPSLRYIVAGWRHLHFEQMTVHTSRACALLLCGLLLASCSGSQEAPPAPRSQVSVTPNITREIGTPQTSPQITPTPTTVAGCGKISPVRTGTSATQTIQVSSQATQSNIQRSFRIHVPVSYRVDKPLPLVFVFHGYGGTSLSLERLTGLSPFADQQGFFVVYPQGLPDENGNPRWSAIGPSESNIDDTLFVENLLTHLQQLYCVDPQRVYATGFSNGGALTAYLACKLTNRIAAFAPVSAPYYEIPGGCMPGRGISMLSFHGTGDPVVPYYEGFTPRGPTRDRFHVLNTPQWLAQWSTRNGCSSGPSAFLQRPTVVGEQWSGCRDNAAFIHYRLIGFGHTWPTTVDDRPGNQIIWDFFKQHPLPTEHSLSLYPHVIMR